MAHGIGVYFKSTIVFGVSADQQEAIATLTAKVKSFWLKKLHKKFKLNFFLTGLVTDDISTDINCVKMIYNRHGFEAWVGWKSKCKGQNLNNIKKYNVDECFR